MRLQEQLRTAIVVAGGALAARLSLSLSVVRRIGNHKMESVQRGQNLREEQT
jgi:hypothetical protein